MNRRRIAVIASVVVTVTLLGPVPGLAERSVAPGEKCGTLLGLSNDADGDRHYRFLLPNGLTEDQVVPAVDFDPATASSDRVARLGLPPRPAASASNRADWNTMAINIKHRSEPRPSCVQPNIFATLATYNMSGYRARAAAGQQYSGAHSSYTAPSYFLSICGGESMGQWAGVTNLSYLIQAGVYVIQPPTGVQSGGFVEIVGGSWDTGGLLSVHQVVPYLAGNRYFFSVQYVDRFRWAFLVQNLDNGDTYSSTLSHSAGGGTAYIQEFGFFVSERLSDNVGNLQYMSHSDVRFRTATVHIYGGSDALMSVQQPDEITMQSKNTLQYLSDSHSLNITSSNFTEHWLACGLAI